MVYLKEITVEEVDREMTVASNLCANHNMSEEFADGINAALTAVRHVLLREGVCEMNEDPGDKMEREMEHALDRYLDSIEDEEVD